MEETGGSQLAALLLQGFESMTAQIRVELARQGHAGATSTAHWAMEAIDAGASDASALGRALGVTRQAAAKSIESLEAQGYVERGVDAEDARRRPLVVTERGHEMTALGAAAYERLRRRLVAQVGEERFAVALDVLQRIPALRADG